MKRIFLTAIACIMFASAGLSQTPPIQAAGYQPVFSEDFTNFDLSSNGYGTHNWYPGIYFEPAESHAGPVSVTPDGLDLQWDRSSGEENTSVEGCAFDASHCNTFRYGYFEARMRWDVTAGAWPAFWMITKQGIQGVAHVGELDIFEGQGNDPTHYYGTINEWNGPTDLVSTNSPANNRYQLPATNDYGQWHTYGLLWVPGTVTWYYDNQAVGTAHTPAIFDQQDFFIVLTTQEGNNWTYGNLAGVTAQSINTCVQWVHVFQPGASAPMTSVQRQAPIVSAVPQIVSSGQVINQGALPTNQTVAFTLSLPVHNEAALNSLLQQISDPQSLKFHQYLTPDEFVANFGPTQQDYDSLVTWAQSKGLTITATNPNRNSVNLSGSVGIINQAFDITLNSYLDSTNNHVFFAPNQEPTLDLSIQVLGITGLSQVNQPLRRSTGPVCDACVHSQLARKPAPRTLVKYSDEDRSKKPISNDK